MTTDPAPADAPCYLYRHWDGTGDALLLYVGITVNLKQRRLDHAQSSRWWRFVSDVTVERYETSVEAARAEAIAIETEQPIFNKRTRGSEGPFRQTQVEHFYVAERSFSSSPLGDLALGLTRRRGRGGDPREQSIGTGPPLLGAPAAAPVCCGISDEEWDREWRAEAS